MANPSGRKGYAGEAPVLDYLRGRGFFRAYRKGSQGARDKGDILGIDDVVIEVKNVSKYDFSGWMRETLIEKANAGAKIAALVVKPMRIGASRVDQWWVVMTLEDYSDLLISAGHGPWSRDA